MKAISLILLLSLVSASVSMAEEVASPSAKVFHIGYSYDRIGDPANWKITALTISLPNGKEKDRYEFQTLRSLKRWLGKLQPGEILQYEVVISLMYSEPKITIYLFVFELGTVTIREDGKLLGKLTISEQEAIKIDHFLYTVRRGKKASRSTLGAPLYRITHETSGQKAGEWSFHITSTKETSKPTLSLRELMTRAEQK